MNQRIFLSPPHMGGSELSFVRDAFESNYIAPLGPMVDAFEREFSELIGIPYCLALSSGTSAMHLALRHLNAGPGDEVLASSLTFIGSVSPTTFLGATPVFIDADRESWNMSPDLLEEELDYSVECGRLPKAVIPTDLYGQCCDLPRIRAICDRFEVPVICDAAEAVGATYDGAGGVQRHAGADAWAAVYSFNGNKIITTSGGGMLASRDRSFIEHARKLSQQARDAAPWYEHTEIGFNYRMSNIAAAIGRGQLEVLSQRVQRRREILRAYQERLAGVPGITFMPRPSWSHPNGWLTVILIDPAEFGVDTHAVREALERENIESRPVWKPMHLQPVFSWCRTRGGAVSESFFKQGLCLPSGSALTDADIDRITRILCACRDSRPAPVRSNRLMSV